MTWALVFILCSRVCTPQYVELYTTKAACEAKMPSNEWYATKRGYCIPVAKGVE